MNATVDATVELKSLHQLVPMAFVQDVERSIGFYERLGFRVERAEGKPGTRVWVWLSNGGAHLMLAVGSRPSSAGAQDILLALYTDEIVEYRKGLIARGVDVGPLTYPEYLPKGQFRIADPDGFDLSVVGR